MLQHRYRYRYRFISVPGTITVTGGATVTERLKKRKNYCIINFKDI
jgi:hypothetical protein